MYLPWSKKNSVNGSDSPATIKPWQLESFLINANRTHPKEWPVSTIILLQYSIPYIIKNNSGKPMTINSIDTAIDKFVNEQYKKHNNKPSAPEIVKVKNYLMGRFEQYVNTEIQREESPASRENGKENPLQR